MAKREDDPDHPIVDRPWQYEIAALSWNRGSGADSSFIDLTLKRGLDVRRLRFVDPKEISVEKGFPEKTSGLFIADVTHRGLDGITVQVGDFEASGGAVSFWARQVQDLDAGHVA